MNVRLFIGIGLLLMVIVTVVVMYPGESEVTVSFDVINETVRVPVVLSSYSSNESEAILVALNASNISLEDVVIRSVDYQPRTSDYYVVLEHENHPVVLIVRNGTNYAYSIDKGPLLRCNSFPHDVYCY